MRNSFRCIKNLAAANTNCKITTFVFNYFQQSVDFIGAAFTIEIIKNKFTVIFSKTIFDHFADSLITTLADQNQCFFYCDRCGTCIFLLRSHSIHTSGLQCHFRPPALSPDH